MPLDAPVLEVPYGAKPPRVTPAMRRWWLDRYSLDELREMADPMWH